MNEDEREHLRKQLASILWLTLDQGSTEREILEIVQDLLDDYTIHRVTCSACGKAADSKTAHLHQGVYVGECCWDDRLKMSE